MISQSGNGEPIVSTYMENDADVESRVVRLSLQKLREITANFSEDRVLGQGGYGIVYKGVCRDGKPIAVRELCPLGGIDDEQFQDELRTLINIKHQNIVRLVGFCNEKEEVVLLHNGRHVIVPRTVRMLCFEYIQNGSLDRYISDSSFLLDWKKRYGIIQGICEGLKYLHEKSTSPIMHLDLKPSNILLDQYMEPKISDFGISRLFVEGNIPHRAIGTIGYMAPEFIEKQAISPKSDIFSLGVIILELLTGSRSGSNDVYSNKSGERVLEKWRERLQTVNGMLERDYQQVRKCIDISRRCLECDRHERPSIGEIVNQLNEIETLVPEEIRAVQNRFDSRKSFILDVYPRELYFQFMLKGRKKDIASCLLQLKNRGDDRVAFMLVSNIPKSYLLKKPLCGVVPPRSTCTLTLTKIKQTLPTPSDGSDFFTLYSAVVGQSDLLDVDKDYTHYNNYFKKSKEYGDKVQVVKLKVICDRTAAKSTRTSPEDRDRVSIATMEVSSR